jgi:hypothetical protein
MDKVRKPSNSEKSPCLRQQFPWFFTFLLNIFCDSRPNASVHLDCLLPYPQLITHNHPTVLRYSTYLFIWLLSLNDAFSNETLTRSVWIYYRGIHQEEFSVRIAAARKLSNILLIIKPVCKSLDSSFIFYFHWITSLWARNGTLDLLAC